MKDFGGSFLTADVSWVTLLGHQRATASTTHIQRDVRPLAVEMWKPSVLDVNLADSTVSSAWDLTGAAMFAWSRVSCSKENDLRQVDLYWNVPSFTCLTHL